jgi:hypothetical protein
MTPADAERRISAHLDAHERLLWTGVPQQGILFRRTDLFLVPFSLMWGGFAIFWETSVLTTGGPTFFALFGIPFVLVGLYLIGGRFLVDAWQRGGMAYGVTGQRIIIVSGVFSRTIKSLQLRTLSDITLDEKADGRGTIRFGPSSGMGQWYEGTSWPGAGSSVSPAFELIPNAREVYNQIREAQKDA